MQKFTRFEDIPPFTDSGSYQVNIGWGYLEDQLKSMTDPDGLELDPEFQRGHVWNETQQIRYVEYILRGGRTARNIYFNAPGWNRRRPDHPGPIVLVDGKQRLEAVRRFMRSEIPAFGTLFREYTDTLRMVGPDFIFYVNDLTDYRQVLQWYIDLNAGGVAHTDEEIAKVRDLLRFEEQKKGGGKRARKTKV